MHHLRGFTMIEVLVAMLLLGGGALATLTLQMHGLRTVREGMLRSQAVMMVNELAELRGEAGSLAADVFTFDTRHRQVLAVMTCRDAACPPADFARASVAQWQVRLRAALPGARAVVCRDGGAQAETAPATWRCDNDATSPVVAKLGWSGGAPAGQPALTLFIGH